MNLKKEVGIAIKSKQTSNQLEQVTRNISCIGYIVITRSQMHAQIKYSLAYLKDLILALASVFCIYIYNSYRAGGIDLAAPVLAGPIFLKVKTKFHFCKRQVMNKSASVILGLNAIILNYDR